MNQPNFKSLDLVNHNKMMIIWDIGPRCNFDCTYCTAYMHDNYSPHATLDELKKTADFVNQYYERYKKFHKEKFTKASISFTGGEPTVNPHFWEFVDYMHANYDENFKLGLTTNGTWPAKHHEKIIKYFKGVTVSYHTEGAESLKERARENILLLNNSNIWTNVNVMMHTDNWDECIDLIDNFLEPNGVNYTPRVIGDGGDYERGANWFEDEDGKMRRTTHYYEPWKMDWLREHWAKQNKKVKEEMLAKARSATASTDFNGADDAEKISQMIKNRMLAQQPTVTPELKGNVQAESARKLGRMCCGGRTMCTKNTQSGEWDTVKFLNSTEFKGWKCMINWFFLHIEQGRDKVLHHQTCKAKFDGTTGEIGTLSESHKILEMLDSYLDRGEMPVITCPNKLCGCGCCIPKAQGNEDFDALWNKYVKDDLKQISIVPVNE